MNKETFINTLKDRLAGRKSTDTSLDDIISRQFDQLQVSLEKSGRRFSFQTGEAELAVAVATSTPQTIALPSNFLSLVYEDALRIYDPDGNLLAVLGRKDYAELARAFDGTRDYPIRYARIGTNIYLFPHNTTSAKTIKVFYHASAALFSSLGSTATNYWLTEAADYFLGTVGLILTTQVIQNTSKETIQLFAAQAAIGQNRLEVKESSEEQEDNFFGEEAL